MEVAASLRTYTIGPDSGLNLVNTAQPAPWLWERKGGGGRGGGGGGSGSFGGGTRSTRNFNGQSRSGFPVPFRSGAGSPNPVGTGQGRYATDWLLYSRGGGQPYSFQNVYGPNTFDRNYGSYRRGPAGTGGFIFFYGGGGGNSGSENNNNNSTAQTDQSLTIDCTNTTALPPDEAELCAGASQTCPTNLSECEFPQVELENDTNSPVNTGAAGPIHAPKTFVTLSMLLVAGVLQRAGTPSGGDRRHLGKWGSISGACFDATRTGKGEARLYTLSTCTNLYSCTACHRSSSPRPLTTDWPSSGRRNRRLGYGCEPAPVVAPAAAEVKVGSTGGSSGGSSGGSKPPTGSTGGSTGGSKPPTSGTGGGSSGNTGGSTGGSRPPSSGGSSEGGTSSTKSSGSLNGQSRSGSPTPFRSGIGSPNPAGLGQGKYSSTFLPYSRGGGNPYSLQKVYGPGTFDQNYANFRRGALGVGGLILFYGAYNAIDNNGDNTSAQADPNLTINCTDTARPADEADLCTGANQTCPTNLVLSDPAASGWVADQADRSEQSDWVAGVLPASSNDSFCIRGGHPAGQSSDKLVAFRREEDKREESLIYEGLQHMPPAKSSDVSVRLVFTVWWEAVQPALRNGFGRAGRAMDHSRQPLRSRWTWRRPASTADVADVQHMVLRLFGFGSELLSLLRLSFSDLRSGFMCVHAPTLVRPFSSIHNDAIERAQQTIWSVSLSVFDPSP
ncbi:hypothetical protein V8E36_009776 [Tilletia maclaganii]